MYYRKNETTFSAFDIAVRFGKKKSIKLFLELGADPKKLSKELKLQEKPKELMKKEEKNLIVYIAAGIFVVVCLCLCIFFSFQDKRKNNLA